MRALAALALLVAGCGGGQGVPAGGAAPMLRNPTVPLGATSRFDAARFAGQWQTLDCLGTCAASVRYARAADGGMARQAGGADTAYTLGAPGVLRRADGAGTLVVMWVDEGFRTAAVGDAEGTWAAVIDRTAKGSPDRRRAAIEILDFNGWDVSQIKRVQ